MSKNQYKSAKKPLFSQKDFKNLPKNTMIIGVDEAGRGSWAGPVVAACVSWSGRNPLKNMLRDSKKMTEKDREITYEEILKLSQEQKVSYGVGVIENFVIDEVGIREANRRAMELALGGLKGVNKKSILLIDGRDNYVFDLTDLPEPHYIIRGDDIVPQIMAASIVAKVTRDRMMREYEKTLPGYGFAQHKGYGTGLHQIALQKLGVCEIHRKSYTPIKLLEK